MARPTRSRRLPIEFSERKNTDEPKSRMTGKKIAEVDNDDKETSNKARNVVTTKSRFAKGNLLAGKRTAVAQMSQLPVLRDRTNLPEERLNVDILVKKGADDKTAKKATKATRQTAKSKVLEEAENEASGKAKNLRQTEAKNRQPVKERTKNLLLEKEITQNTQLEKGNTLAMAPEKKNILSLPKEKAQNVPAKENTKKLKVTKKASGSDVEDDSPAIKSKNVTDSENTPKVPSVRAGSKKIRRRIEFSKLLLTKQSEKSIENLKKKSLRRSAELGKKAQNVPTRSDATTAGKKFFKSKGVGVADNEKKILPSKKILTSKQRKVDVREKAKVSTSFRLRQTTLGESFAKHATKKTLRPRQKPVNYHEQSTILEKTVANDKNAIKGPVYKTTKFLNKSDDDGSEIYEFHFDSNDSREKIAKKRNRKVGKSVITKKMRAKDSSSKKTISKPRVAVKSAVKENKVNKQQTEFRAASVEAMDTDNVPAVDTSNFDLPPVTIKPTQSVKVQSQPKNVESQLKKLEQKSEMVKEKNAKPKVVECTPLTGGMRINLTSTPLIPKSTEANAGTFRNTNAFIVRSSVQHRTMLNHVLFNKSLSPITKALENFDPGSPWRPPDITGQQFSRIKNVVQSTPQIRNFSTIMEKNKNNIDSKAEPRLTAESRINKIVEKNEDTNAEAKPMAQKILGLAKSPRKFGTVISNVNLSIPGASPVVIHENSDKSDLNRSSLRKVATIPSWHAAPSKTRISDDSDAEDNFDDHADKENSIPLFVSPKKSLKSPKKLVAMQSPLRPFNQLKTVTKENWEPQPGPSGLQKRSPLSQSRILTQSNLNNFLNTDQVPTCTKFNDGHGIFDDAHSTPIIGKPIKIITKEANLENAFGFDDIEDSVIGVPSFKSDLFADPPVVRVVKKMVTKQQKINGKDGNTQPTRLSIGEIKKHLRPVNSKDKDKDDSIERIEEEEKENRESRKEKSVLENEKVDEAITFSDTFDVLKAAEANGKKNAPEISLFADLEAVHFKQPPRHSYKRKRIIDFNFSEDEEEEDREASIGYKSHVTKKRKISKAEKQRQKKMEEWANDINHTFDEIDHFDLVVE